MHNSTPDHYRTTFCLSVWNKTVQALDWHMSLRLKVRQSLSWWMITKNLVKGKSFLPVVWRVVRSDASLSGWGAVLEEATVQGRWSWRERSLPINILEIQAARLVLSFWTSRLQGCPVGASRTVPRLWHTSIIREAPGVRQPRRKWIAC